MTLLQALAYFSREATLNLLRGWKVSLLAVLTIAVSLFLIGLFLLVGGNARSVVEGWRAESRVVLYLETGTSTERVAALQARLDAEPWTARTEIVTPAEASSRFRQAFPSLSGLLDGWGEEPLPTSIEIEPAVGIASSRV
ncbi:MAG: permease-like cell division protein FtsX, partial [Acidobacteriota bacterium]